MTAVAAPAPRAAALDLAAALAALDRLEAAHVDLAEAVQRLEEATAHVAGVVAGCNRLLQLLKADGERMVAMLDHAASSRLGKALLQGFGR